MCRDQKLKVRVRRLELKKSLAEPSKNDVVAFASVALGSGVFASKAVAFHKKRRKRGWRELQPGISVRIWRHGLDSVPAPDIVREDKL